MTMRHKDGKIRKRNNTIKPVYSCSETTLKRGLKRWSQATNKIALSQSYILHTFLGFLRVLQLPRLTLHQRTPQVTQHVGVLLTLTQDFSKGPHTCRWYQHGHITGSHAVQSLWDKKSKWPHWREDQQNNVLGLKIICKNIIVWFYK